MRLCDSYGDSISSVCYYPALLRLISTGSNWAERFPKENDMKSNSSRRNFLAAGLALPVAGLSASRMAAAPALPALEPQPDAGNSLNYRILGKTGLKVTTVGYGCMITSDPSVISRAVDMGINYFDTSRWYQKGNNERMVGAALGNRRKNVFLSTKVDATSKKGALDELEMSLKELATDHLDIWYLHGKDKPEAISDELIEAQEIARQQGKTRFIGLTTHNPEAILERVLQCGKMEVVISTYNFTMGGARDKAFEAMNKAGIGLVAMKVMAGGTRGKEPRPEMKRPGAHSAALKWVIKTPFFATTVPSMTDMDQLDQNFRAMADTFNDGDAKTLTAWLQKISPSYCRMCYQCDGICPQGIPVAEVLRYLTYAEGYGQFALGREKFLNLPADVRAVRCGDCSSCAVRCPNGVQVSRELSRAQELLA
jgi:uncharacterized protein